jgi:hypothetical protein
MHGTVTPTDIERPVEGNDLKARLNWLLAVNAEETRRRKLFGNAAEEEELLLMRRPLSTGRAFALFGLVLGLFPPAAIFIKMFGYGAVGYHSSFLLFIGCLLMNFTCAGVGYAMGQALGRAIENVERQSWTAMMILLPLIGAAWGGVTGFAGGLIFIGIGAIFGAIFAIPIGALCFTLFAPFHRILARGGMIDARHFWPLASGASLLAAALVLGL